MPQTGQGSTHPKPGYLKNQRGSPYIVSIQPVARNRRIPPHITRPKMMRNAASEAMSITPRTGSRSRIRLASGVIAPASQLDPAQRDPAGRAGGVVVALDPAA